MHSRNYGSPRGSRSWLKSLMARRGALQIVLGALVIAAIALAFRPGQDSASRSATATPAPSPAVATAGVITPATPATPATAATPAAAATTPGPSQEKTHTVAAGDTLTSIAQKYYGDASKWSKVFDANRDTLPTANALQLGQKLKIPD